MCGIQWELMNGIGNSQNVGIWSGARIWGHFEGMSTMLKRAKRSTSSHAAQESDNPRGNWRQGLCCAAHSRLPQQIRYSVFLHSQTQAHCSPAHFSLGLPKFLHLSSTQAPAHSAMQACIGFEEAAQHAVNRIKVCLYLPEPFVLFVTGFQINLFWQAPPAMLWRTRVLVTRSEATVERWMGADRTTQTSRRCWPAEERAQPVEDFSKPSFPYDTIRTFWINYTHYNTIITLLLHLWHVQKSYYYNTLWQKPGKGHYYT